MSKVIKQIPTSVKYRTLSKQIDGKMDKKGYFLTEF